MISSILSISGYCGKNFELLLLLCCFKGIHSVFEEDNRHQAQYKLPDGLLLVLLVALYFALLALGIFSLCVLWYIHFTTGT